MIIATSGCSHAGYSFTPNPWPVQMSKLLDAELILASSPGAGIDICVDKLAWILNNHKVDHVFFQAPSDLRMCIGVNSVLPSLQGVEGNVSENENHLHNGNQFYSFIMTLVRGNKRALTSMVDPGAEELWNHFDEIWNKYFLDNFYENRINFIKQLLLVENLCKSHRVNYNIFTWHDFPWDSKNELFQSWISRLDMNYVNKESVISFLKRTNRMDKNTENANVEFSSDGYHLNDLGSTVLAKEYIMNIYNK
jgi:hypothetical protein